MPTPRGHRHSYRTCREVQRQLQQRARPPARRELSCCYTAEQFPTTHHERRSSPVVQQLGYLAAIFCIDDAVSVKTEC